MGKMERYTILSDKREIVWLTVSYSPATKGWFVETTYPGFITHAIAKAYIAVRGQSITYMVKGFDDKPDAKEFAIDYHEAKRDGFVHRLRLD